MNLVTELRAILAASAARNTARGLRIHPESATIIRARGSKSYAVREAGRIYSSEAQAYRSACAFVGCTSAESTVKRTPWIFNEAKQQFEMTITKGTA